MGRVNFRVEFDPDAGLYLRVSDNAVARTVELEVDRAWVNLDRSGEVVGIEMLGSQRRAERRPYRIVDLMEGEAAAGIEPMETGTSQPIPAPIGDI